MVDPVHAAVVAYNPGRALLELTTSLLAAGIGVLIVDNDSEEGLDILSACSALGARILLLDDNLGVGGALNRALGVAGLDAPWLLTLDQDTVASQDALRRLVTSPALDDQRVAQIGPRLVDAVGGAVLQDHPGRGRIGDATSIVTSGAFCRVSALVAVGGFRADLFIDLVDVDLSMRLRRAGWRVVVDRSATLAHTIGSPIRLGTRVLTTNHNPDRLYYRYRNMVLLSRQDAFAADREWQRRATVGLAAGVVKVLLLEPSTVAKLSAIGQGLLDGLRGRSGPRPTHELEYVPFAEDRPSVSVCMATFNGAAYIGRQLTSILDQLEPGDEVLIIDDASDDDTVALIDAFADPRVHVEVNPVNIGVIATFERCLTKARHEVIFLADQDDEWLPGKVDATLAAMDAPGVTAVVTDAIVVDADMVASADSFFALTRSGPGVLHNFVKNSYLGCCMAIRQEVLDVALPVPRSVRTHDGWIGICADLVGRVVFVPRPFVLYRRHGGNLSPMSRLPLADVARRRALLAWHLLRVWPASRRLRTPS